MESPTTRSPTYVGIDVAAQTLAVVILAPATVPTVPAAALTVPNTAAGWQTVQTTLTQQGATLATTLLVMEATGAYWQGCASALTAAGWAVSVVSPGSARHYARARLRRAKTDAVDAAVLAAYGRDLQPARWTPPPAEVQALQLLIRERDDLVAMQTQVRNRQHALAQVPHLPAEVWQPLAAVAEVVTAQIAALNQLIRQRAAAAASLASDLACLQTITGVGLLTAAIVVVETRPLRQGLTPKQAVAYAGLDPAPHESGTSVRGAGHISKTGNARLRQACYMAAVSAARHNPPLRAFYERLLARGKRKKVALVAVARKLLVLMITLLRHHQPFVPDWATQHPQPRR